jgi:hypothetical protein
MKRVAFLISGVRDDGPPQTIKSRRSTPPTTLKEAIRANDVESVMKLWPSSDHVLLPAIPSNDSCLTYAVLLDSDDVVKWLVEEALVDVENSPQIDGHSPL